MAQALTPSDKRSTPKGSRPAVAAEEPFWRRYSPHHEFPLSSVLALAACAVVLGVLLVLEVLHSNRQDELQRPPKMDAVEIEGGGGTDGPGLADGSGRPQGSRTEAVENTKPTPLTPNSGAAPQLKDVIQPKPLDVPDPAAKAEIGDPSIFDQLRVDAEKQVAAAMALTPVRKGDPKGGKNPGVGGGEGGGEGSGSGKHKGPGTGTSKFGEVLTKQQKHEMRWRLIFNTQDAQDHLDQLRALKITLAIPTPQEGSFQVIDLTRKPPVGRIENLMQQREKVKWLNTTAPSLQGLAAVLRLSQVPRYVVIFLPPEMEETLARLEREYRNLPENQITLTEFEIRRRRDGRYTPEVISQR